MLIKYTAVSFFDADTEKFYNYVLTFFYMWCIMIYR